VKPVANKIYLLIFISLLLLGANHAISARLTILNFSYHIAEIAHPENPSLEPNTKCIGCTVCKMFTFKLYCDLETWVQHSGLLKVIESGTIRLTTYNFIFVFQTLPPPPVKPPPTPVVNMPL